MGKIESLQQQFQELSPEERAEFRAWFLDRDWAEWDVQLELDVQAGRLDALAERALREHAAGTTTPLTEPQQLELERRIAEDDANADDGVSWEEVRARALARVRQ